VKSRGLIHGKVGGEVQHQDSGKERGKRGAVIIVEFSWCLAGTGSKRGARLEQQGTFEEKSVEERGFLLRGGSLGPGKVELLRQLNPEMRVWIRRTSRPGERQPKEGTKLLRNEGEKPSSVSTRNGPLGRGRAGEMDPLIDAGGVGRLPRRKKKPPCSAREKPDHLGLDKGCLGQPGVEGNK